MFPFVNLNVFQIVSQYTLFSSQVWPFEAYCISIIDKSWLVFFPISKFNDAIRFPNLTYTEPASKIMGKNVIIGLLRFVAFFWISRYSKRHGVEAEYLTVMRCLVSELMVRILRKRTSFVVSTIDYILHE